MNNEKVLVVEDNRIICNFMLLILTEFGYCVTVVNSGKDALTSLHSTKFDIMVADFWMPGMSGMELIENIRKNDDQLKIVMMTAVPELINREKAIEFKISAILSKPFLMNTLLNTLSDVRVSL